MPPSLCLCGSSGLRSAAASAPSRLPPAPGLVSRSALKSESTSFLLLALVGQVDELDELNGALVPLKLEQEKLGSLFGLDGGVSRLLNFAVAHLLLLRAVAVQRRAALGST